MTDRICQNTDCTRPLHENSPSLYYCTFLCATAAAERDSSSHTSYVARGMRASSGCVDPTSWDTRSSNPITSKANVEHAFPWLDSRHPDARTA